MWNSSPDRYRAIGEHYRPRLQPGTPFSIDVNVVDRIPPGRPLNKPRGLELYELVANVAANVDLITLYAFSTFSPDDMRLVPFVLGAQQMTGGSTEEGTVAAQRQLYLADRYARENRLPRRPGMAVPVRFASADSRRRAQRLDASAGRRAPGRARCASRVLTAQSSGRNGPVSA